MSDDLILQELREIGRWIRILAGPRLLETLRTGILTAEDYAIYQASDGGSTRDVARSTKVSDRTVRKRWRAWAAAGLMEATETDGRYRRIVDLSDVGFEIPQ